LLHSASWCIPLIGLFPPRIGSLAVQTRHAVHARRL
jgi:hypothetical protein